MRAFWNERKFNKTTKVVSKLKPNDFNDFYYDIMHNNVDNIYV
jgi:hypothetical protein